MSSTRYWRPYSSITKGQKQRKHGANKTYEAMVHIAPHAVADKLINSSLRQSRTGTH